MDSFSFFPFLFFSFLSFIKKKLIVIIFSFLSVKKEKKIIVKKGIFFYDIEGKKLRVLYIYVAEKCFFIYV